MNNEPEKKLNDVAKATQTVKKEQEALRNTIEKSTKAYQDSLQPIKNYVLEPSFVYKNIEKIIESTIRLNVDVERLAQAHKDGYDSLIKKNKAEIEANAKQIEAISKNIEKQKELAESYKTRSELIVEHRLNMLLKQLETP